jgi:phage gp29-like protein
MLGQMAPTTEDPQRIANKQRDDEYGSSGTPLVSGYITEEANYKLRGTQGSKVFDEMRKTDAQVNASLMAMELPIRATKWYVEPAYNSDGETEEQDKQIAEFVEKALFDYMDSTWDDFLREVLTMLPFGFSVFEKVFAMQDTEYGKKIVLQKLAYRKQRTIDRWEQQDRTP